MGKPNQSGKPHLRTSHIDINPIEITKDDHRNNPEFLKNNPHAKVVEKNSTKKIKKAHKHHSASKHHVGTKTKKHTSKISVAHHKSKKPGDKKHILINDEDENMLDNPNLQDDDGDLSNYEDNNDQEYLHHEATDEEHDPMSDLDNNNEKNQSRYDHDAGPSNHSLPIYELPKDLHIDPSSWNFVASSDGSTSFKASLIFNQDEENSIDLDNFDIIITQVSP